MTGIAQLALSVQLPDDETFDSFKSHDNLVVIAQLKSFIESTQSLSVSEGTRSNPNSFYLFGSMQLCLHCTSIFLRYHLLQLLLNLLQGLKSCL